MGTYGDKYAQAVSAELRAERGRTRYTIADIVESTGLSKSAVLNYLNGKRDIPTSAFLDLCRALDADPRVILDRALTSIK
ncbi:helix-turn-helix domain-containing protein [Paramicrobacterium sp. CJ85]|uniref:helix-turn-helix domain-containing protein n=1 Tax=Paramicrobacterium sp. CJ85 TaxID=3445355 RepID=UPI003F5F2053